MSRCPSLGSGQQVKQQVANFAGGVGGESRPMRSAIPPPALSRQYFDRAVRLLRNAFEQCMVTITDETTLRENIHWEPASPAGRSSCQAGRRGGVRDRRQALDQGFAPRTDARHIDFRPASGAQGIRAITGRISQSACEPGGRNRRSFAHADDRGSTASCEPFACEAPLRSKAIPRRN
jgi:hypothetical protein